MKLLMMPMLLASIGLSPGIGGGAGALRNCSGMLPRSLDIVMLLAIRGSADRFFDWRTRTWRALTCAWCERMPFWAAELNCIETGCSDRYWM